MRTLYIIFLSCAVLFLSTGVPALGENWEDHLERADSLSTEWEIEMALDEAVTALRQVEEKYGPEDTVVLRVLYMVGNYNLDAHDYVAAESLFTRCLETAKNRYDNDGRFAARAYSGLAQVRRSMGRNDMALAYFQKSLDICIDYYGDDHKSVGIILNNMALLNMNIGNLDMAERQFTKSLEIIKKVHGPESPKTTVGYKNLAQLYEKRGMYTRAEILRRRVLDIRKKYCGENDPVTASAILDLGNFYKSIGRDEEAEGYYLEAISKWEKTLGPDHMYVARGLAFLAKLYVGEGRLEEAEQAARRSLIINERELGPISSTVGDDLRTLGTVYSEQGRMVEAEAAFLQGLEISNNSIGPDHPYTLYSMLKFSLFYMDYGRLDRADSLLNKALNSLETNGTEDHVLKFSILESLGKLYRLKNDSLKALFYACRSTDLRSKILHDNIITMSENDALKYSQFARTSLDLLLSCYFDYTGWSDSIQYNVLELVQFNKGLITDGIFERQQSVKMRRDPETAAILDSLRQAKYRLSNLFTSGPRQVGDEYRQDIDSLERSIADIEKRLFMDNTDIHKWNEYKEYAVDSIVLSLPESGTFIDYFKFNYYLKFTDTTIPHYLATIIAKDGTHEIVDLGEAGEIDRLVDSYRRHMNHIAALGGVTTGADRDNYIKLSRTLYHRVWRPVEKLIGDGGMVLIGPDAALNMVSFAGLCNDEDMYLIEKYRLHYLSSGRDLMRLKGIFRKGRGMLAMGDPDFNAPTSERISACPETTEEKGKGFYAESGNVRSACVMFDDLRLSSLPETRKEIEMISRNWRKSGGEPVEIHLGYEASEDIFKMRAPGNKVIHLATHGYFLEGVCCTEEAGVQSESSLPYSGENPLLLSGLFLAGANIRPESSDSAGIEDGILTACEVSALDLDGVDLVVLSACETGLGELQAGEGVFGLRRAFQIAGARTVISTIWPVLDKSAKEIFSDLYVREELGLAENVRRIQLNRINGIRAAGGNDHPYNWGGIVVFGDWR